MTFISLKNDKNHTNSFLIIAAFLEEIEEEYIFADWSQVDTVKRKKNK